MGQSIVTSLVGSAIVEFTNGHFELRDIAVPLLVLAQRSLEGLKDTAITP